MSYIDGVTRHLTMALASLQRRRFSTQLRQAAWGVCLPPEHSLIPLHIVSFSSARDIEEQFLSVLSFYRWVGRPLSWTIYSDGTHQKVHLNILQQLGDCVQVVPWNSHSNLPAAHAALMSQYAAHPKQFAMGRRLCAYVTHVLSDEPTIFVDSDVIFYRLAQDLLLAGIQERPFWFLADPDWGCLDSRYLSNRQRTMYQANGGCFVLRRDFCWDGVLAALSSFAPEYEYFSDQTAYHAALLQQGAWPLDPRKFVVSTSDLFSWSTPFRPSSIALRHYTGPVRHKLWQKPWRWHLMA